MMKLKILKVEVIYLKTKIMTTHEKRHQSAHTKINVIV